MISHRLYRYAPDDVLLCPRTNLSPLKFFLNIVIIRTELGLYKLLKESISKNTFYDLVGIDAGNKLLETNILAFHFNPREVTF